MPRVQKANPCLKGCFILFSVLLGIAGCVLLILALMATHSANEIGNAAGGFVWIYIMAVACIIVSVMGTFGAHKENVVVLRMCLGEMVAGAIGLFIVGSRVSQLASQLRGALQTESDYIKDYLNDAIRAALGFIYGFAAAAMLGALLCMSLLCQISGYTEPEASPVRGSNDCVTVPSSAVPTMHADPMISAVPMPYCPVNMDMSAYPSIPPSSTAYPEPGRGMSAYKS